MEIRGRSRTLKINYRTSHQIRKRFYLLLGTEIADVDGDTEKRLGTISVFSEPEPLIAIAESAEEESRAVADWLTDLIGKDLKPHEISVFVRSANQIERATTAVETSGLQFTVLGDHVHTTEGHVSVGAMHLARD